MPVIRLTQHFVNHEALCPPPKTRIEYCDADLPGLYVLASSAGKVTTYFFRYKDKNGKTCHQKIARTTDIDLAEARKKAKQLKAEIVLGADPRGEENARKEVLTFSAFFQDHYLPYVKPRKRSWKRDEELFRLRLQPTFGSVQINLLKRQDIQSFHTDLLAEGLAHATCDHHIKLLKHALNLAIDWGLLTEKNPAARIPLFNADNKVEHYLDDAELDGLLKVLKAEPRGSANLVALYLLSTGCRLNEALQGRWSQIDRVHRVWRIPASNSKSKRIRSVPLNDSAIDVLNQVDTEGKFEYLFINPKRGEPFVNVHKAWGILRDRAGLPHLRIHDLRHQYASFLVNSGRTLYEVQQILGHSDSKVTERYAHLSTKSLQDAANSASVIIKGAMPAVA